jgi:hypothetical protein
MKYEFAAARLKNSCSPCRERAADHVSPVAAYLEVRDA